MWEFFTSIYAFWNYIEDTGKLRKIYLTVKMYSQFVVFYWKNPEVRIKYSRKMNIIEKDSDTLERIREALVDEGFGFSKFTKDEPNEVVFNLRSSRLNYVIQRDDITENKMNILVETKFASYYPIRKFEKLNDVTSSFNRVCSAISSLYEFEDEKRVVFAEFEVERKREGKKKFERSSAEIIFDEDGFQINNMYGSDHARFLFFLSMKWLLESDKQVENVEEIKS